MTLVNLSSNSFYWYQIRRIARLNTRTPVHTKIVNQNVRIFSENDFPTAAGLASSASGYAALVYAMGMLFGIEGDITSIARQGSGSACR